MKLTGRKALIKWSGVAAVIQGINVLEQEKLDGLMIEMDGTDNKCKLNLNSTCGNGVFVQLHLSALVDAFMHHMTVSVCLSAKFGANSILGVSLAICKAGAAEKGVPLYRHIADLAGNGELVLPVPVSGYFYAEILFCLT